MTKVRKQPLRIRLHRNPILKATSLKLLTTSPLHNNHSMIHLELNCTPAIRMPKVQSVKHVLAVIAMQVPVLPLGPQCQSIRGTNKSTLLMVATAIKQLS